MHKSFLRLVMGLAALVVMCPAYAADIRMEKLGYAPVVLLTMESDLKLWTSERLAEMNQLKGTVDFDSCKISPHGRHLAAVELKDNGKCCVWLDGKESPIYDQVRGLVRGAYRDQDFEFSPDGNRLAYTARKGSKWVMVVDGKESAEFDGVREPYFSADSKHICYVGFRGKDAILVLDGKECGKYPGICMNFPSFTAKTPQRQIDTMYCPGIFGPNGRFAYSAVKARGKDGTDKIVAVIDGKETSAYDGIGGIEFSPDGKHVAFVARKAERKFVVLDGKPEAKYGDIDGLLTFSPDSKRLAYVATNYDANGDGQSFVVLDGKPGQKFHDISGISVSFSPDSKHLSYFASPDSEKYCMVVDGKAGKTYDEVGEMGREPCQIYGPDGRLYYSATKGDKHYMVIDGVQSPVYDDMVQPYPVLSRDGKHYAFTAMKNDRWFVVHDGVEGAHYGTIYDASLAITGDNKLVYKAAKPDSCQYITVIDGKEHPEIENPAFSPDGTRMAYIMENDNNFINKESVMLDGRKIGEFESVFGFNFDPNNNLTFLAVHEENKGDMIEKCLYRVEVASK
ncbi:MAG: hypothetical protein ABFD83_03560 [Armatimonadota bacterium]